MSKRHAVRGNANQGRPGSGPAGMPILRPGDYHPAAPSFTTMARAGVLALSQMIKDPRELTGAAMSANGEGLC
jgi:hypothetical protein